MLRETPFYRQVEGQRGLFFMLGLCLVLALMIFTLEWSFPREQIEPQAISVQAEPEEAHLFLPRLIAEKPSATAAKRPNPAAKPQLNAEPLPTVAAPTSAKALSLQGLAPIGQEDGPADEAAPAPMPAAWLENIARPKECIAITDKEEQMRCFNGWVQAYIGAHINLPARWQRWGHSETLYLEFVISQEGSLESIELLRGEQAELFEAAKQALQGLPVLEPARHLGKPVRMKMVLPLRFKTP